jgi:hypothetical protein
MSIYLRNMQRSDARCHESMQRASLLSTEIAFQHALDMFRGTTLLAIGDSTIREKVELLRRHGVPDACGGGPGVCFVWYELLECARPRGYMSAQWKQCRETIARPCSFLSNRSDQTSLWSEGRVVTQRAPHEWEVILWNSAGMHALVRPDSSRKNCGRSVCDGMRFGDFFRSLSSCAIEMSMRFAQNSLRILMLTNHICTGQFYGEWTNSSNTFSARSEHFDATMSFTSEGVHAVHAAERHAALLAAHALQHTFTDGMCECTTDGRHFRELAPSFLVRLAHKVAAHKARPHDWNESWLTERGAYQVDWSAMPGQRKD